MSIKRRKALLSAVTLLIAFALVWIVAARLDAESGSQEQERGVSTQHVGQLKRVSYNGATYREKPAMTSLLLIGTDREEGSTGYGARQGGQADFLLLVVIDDNEKAVHQLQIDRDTITAVETLGVLGNPVGTKQMQICLAHAFGVTPEDNCQSVLKAVENLLEGIEIDHYFCMEMGSIGKLNDALGGVTVTLNEDLTVLDPQMAKGATLTLNAEQAELLIRSRMQVGDGTNKSRMQRQRLFMDAAADTLKKRIKQDVGFANSFLDQLEADITMDMQRSALLNQLNKAYGYEIGPVQTIDGEHTIGSDGFMEFHAAPGAAVQWVIDVFYEREDD